MAVNEDIRSLKDLIEYGIEAATEDEKYYYIYAADPNRSYYDSSLYRYNKQTGEIEWFTSDLCLLDSIVMENIKPVKDLSIFKTMI